MRKYVHESRSFDQARANHRDAAGERRSTIARVPAAQEAEQLESLDDLYVEAARIVALLDGKDQESQVKRDGEELADLVADRVVDAVTERLVSLELH